MAIMRQGVWKCPSCERHQVWRMRGETARLDRRCQHCGNRVRVTLNRSSSGQGRHRNVQIWEREASLDPRELAIEAERRDDVINKLEEDIGSVSSSPSEEASQSDLSVIWGAGWRPAHVLEFSKPLQSEAARAELLRFFAERHDGHLIAVATCWDGMDAPDSFEGESFHRFSKKFVGAFEESLLDRLLSPEISSVHAAEVIPRRTADIHLKRRTARLLVDTSTMPQKDCSLLLHHP